jgi:hypothetical protein
VWIKAEPSAIRRTRPPCAQPFDPQLSALLDAAIATGDVQGKADLKVLIFGDEVDVEDST